MTNMEWDETRSERRNKKYYISGSKYQNDFFFGGRWPSNKPVPERKEKQKEKTVSTCVCM